MKKTPYSERNAELSQRAHEIAKKVVYPKLFQTSDIKWEYPGGQDDELSRLLDAGMGVDVVAHVNAKNNQLRQGLKQFIQERWRTQDALSFGDITITEWNNRSNLPSELYKMNAHYFVYGITDGLTSNGPYVVNQPNWGYKIVFPFPESNLELAAKLMEASNYVYWNNNLELRIREEEISTQLALARRNFSNGFNLDLDLPDENMRRAPIVRWPKRILRASVIDMARVFRGLISGTLDYSYKDNDRTNQTFITIDLDILRLNGMVVYEYISNVIG